MLIEAEHNKISKKAVLLAVIFHVLILVTAVIWEFEKLQHKTDEYIDLEIGRYPKEEVNHIQKKNEIPLSENSQKTKIKPPSTESEATHIEEINNISLPVEKNTIVIDHKYDSILDSVLISHPSFYGLKYAMKNNMGNINDSTAANNSPIEIARNNLKKQLIALYKDRYGDISPDKYAGQNKQGGLGVSIPIDDIINLLSEIF